MTINDKDNDNDNDNRNGDDNRNAKRNHNRGHRAPPNGSRATGSWPGERPGALGGWWPVRSILLSPALTKQAAKGAPKPTLGCGATAWPDRAPKNLPRGYGGKSAPLRTLVGNLNRDGRRP